MTPTQQRRFGHFRPAGSVLFKHKTCDVSQKMRRPLLLNFRSIDVEAQIDEMSAHALVIDVCCKYAEAMRPFSLDSASHGA